MLHTKLFASNITCEAALTMYSQQIINFNWHLIFYASNFFVAYCIFCLLFHRTAAFETEFSDIRVCTFHNNKLWTLGNVGKNIFQQTVYMRSYLRVLVLYQLNFLFIFHSYVFVTLRFYSVYRLMLGLMLPTWFLSMWISNTAATSMMIPIIQAVVHTMEEVHLATCMCFLKELVLS